MNLWKDIKNLPPSAPNMLYAVIETPRGSKNRYVYETSSETFVFRVVSYSPYYYPADYGIIPQTLGNDGNPLNIMVLIDQPTFSGCVIKINPIGILKMKNRNKSDDKIIGVPLDDPHTRKFKDIQYLPLSFINEVTHFFLEELSAEILGFDNKKEAMRIIKGSMNRYNEMISFRSLFLLD